MADAILSRPARALEATIVGAGTACAGLAAIVGMRKRLPAWAPAGTAGHFLKHADEQTVVAVAAVETAIQAGGIDLAEQRQWAVVAAPRFVGRLAGASVLDRFARGGGPAVSPHVIPQHSLHSVSGALSILLSTCGPNFGVGGSCESLADGFLAALTLGGICESRGTWFIATAWEPEPTADAAARCTNAPVCHAFAMAIQAAAAGAVGQIRFVPPTGSTAESLEAGSPTVAQVAAALDAAAQGHAPPHLAWPLPWGGNVTLEINAQASRLKAAA